MEPFERQERVDKPGIVGAKWWHASLVDEAAKIARRKAIGQILVAGTALAGLGAILTMCIKGASSSSDPEVKDGRETALGMQKDYGWSFGATDEALVFDGTTEKPFDPGAPILLTSAMTPSAKLAPYYQSTLFTATSATPAKLGQMAPEDAAAFKLLLPSLKPVFTPAMRQAYARGQSMASLFAAIADAKGPTPRTALIVDLPGPEAVAFAAGASSAFEPVCLFDNWPHPRGVVRAHETLSAAIYYQPTFAKAQGGQRLPMFVLDRRRLSPYTDDATQFDNRYVAKLPWPAAAMKGLGVDDVLYIVPTAGDASRELDDLNDDFVAYAKGGVTVRIVSLDAFSAATPNASSATPATTADRLISESGYTYYGGQPNSHFAFFADYPVAKSPRPASLRPQAPRGASYVASPRQTAYSSGRPAGSPNKPRPDTFGTVPVVIAVGTGVILGARYARSGSWNRTTGGGWGG